MFLDDGDSRSSAPSHLPQYANSADPEDPDAKDEYREVRIEQVCPQTRNNRFPLHKRLIDTSTDHFRHHSHNRPEPSPRQLRSSEGHRYRLSNSHLASRRARQQWSTNPVGTSSLGEIRRQARQ